MNRQRNQTIKEKMIDKLKLGNSEELNREMNNKMQRMLEESLARNVQLQKVSLCVVLFVTCCMAQFFRVEMHYWRQKVPRY